jgi:hypothetical protein
VPETDSSGPRPAVRSGGWLPRLRLRPLVFLLLLGIGVVPLAISNGLLVRQNRDLLITEEKRYLTHSAQSLSRELNDYLGETRRQLHELGLTLLAAPGAAPPDQRLREPWVGSYLQRFVVSNPNLLALRVLAPDGAGPRLAPPDLAADLSDALDSAFAVASQQHRPVWQFAVAGETNEPVAALAVPVDDAEGRMVFVVEVLSRLRLMEAVFEREATGNAAVFLLGSDGSLLWSEGADDASRQALARSNLVRDFVRKPLLLTAEYTVATEQ